MPDCSMSADCTTVHLNSDDHFGNITLSHCPRQRGPTKQRMTCVSTTASCAYCSFQYREYLCTQSLSHTMPTNATADRRDESEHIEAVRPTVAAAKTSQISNIYQSKLENLMHTRASRSGRGIQSSVHLARHIAETNAIIGPGLQCSVVPIEMWQKQPRVWALK